MVSFICVVWWVFLVFGNVVVVCDLGFREVLWKVKEVSVMLENYLLKILVIEEEMNKWWVYL